MSGLAILIRMSRPRMCICTTHAKVEWSKRSREVIECRKYWDGQDRNSVVLLMGLRPSFDTRRPVVTS
jgi:hypothetical protein